MPPKDIVTGLYNPNYESPFYKDYIIKPGQGVQKKTKAKKEKIVAIDNKDNKNEENIGVNDDNIKKEEENKENIIADKDKKDEGNDLKEENINEGLETAETHPNENGNNKEEEIKIDS